MASADTTNEIAGSELELSEVGAPRGIPKHVVEATLMAPGGFAERAAFFRRRDPIAGLGFETPYDDYPHLDLQDVVRREVDGVNYVQGYVPVTEGNLRQVLEIVNSHGLVPGDQELLSSIYATLAVGTPQQKADLVASIQQIRFFDPRHKQIQFDGGDNTFSQIEFKFHPDVQGRRRKMLWRAKDNGDEKVIRALDACYEAFEKIGEPARRVERIFIAHEWLPSSILEHFDLAERLQGKGPEVARLIYDMVAQVYAVKLDLRVDPALGLVTSETELKALSGHPKLALIESDVLATVGEGLRANGGVLYDAKQLNLADIALADDPRAAVDSFLEGRGMDAAAIAGIRADMASFISRATARYGLEPERQIIVPNWGGRKFPRINELNALSLHPDRMKERIDWVLGRG